MAGVQIEARSLRRLPKSVDRRRVATSYPGALVSTTLRVIAGIFMSLVTFLAVGTVGFIALRITWPDYAAVEAAVNAFYAGGAPAEFSVPMMAARLIISAISSVVAAWIAALTLRDTRIAPLAGGLALLAAFIPLHISLWDKFPLWYHATFLTSLPVLAIIGGRFARSSD